VLIWSCQSTGDKFTLTEFNFTIINRERLRGKTGFGIHGFLACSKEFNFKVMGHPIPIGLMENPQPGQKKGD
jgi:hypothetical protein